MRHLSPSPAAQLGLTLVELMVALVIGALLMMTAAPYLGDYINNSRLREGGNQLLSEALMAQAEAVKRNAPVRLSTAGAVVQVIDISVPATPVTLRERILSGGVTMATAQVDFDSQGRPMPFGTAAAIDLSGTGMLCTSDLRCPGLRIDAGGAIRLCGNNLSCP